MELLILEVGLDPISMAMASKFGKMGLNTKVIGNIMSVRVWANCGKKMEIITKVNGKIIWLMVKELTFTKINRCMKGNGLMICSMGMARRFGLMDPYIKDIISRVSNTV